MCAIAQEGMWTRSTTLLPVTARAGVHAKAPVEAHSLHVIRRSLMEPATKSFERRSLS